MCARIRARFARLAGSKRTLSNKMFWVLATVIRYPDVHAYALHDALLEDVNPSLKGTFLAGSRGSTYASINTLLRQGMIMGRIKKEKELEVYRVTKAGRDTYNLYAPVILARLRKLVAITGS